MNINSKTEASETKIKKQEEMIDILLGEVKRLKTELAKYELIKELVNNKSGNFLTEREKKEMLKRQGVDLDYVNDGSYEEKAIETKKNSQCWVCGLETHNSLKETEEEAVVIFVVLTVIKTLKKILNEFKIENKTLSRQILKPKNGREEELVSKKQWNTLNQVRKKTKSFVRIAEVSI